MEKYSIIIIVLFVLLFMYLLVRGYMKDRKYGITLEGGRGGDLVYKKDGKIAKIEYEMREDGGELMLYDNSIAWSQPRKEIFTEQELKVFYQAIQEWGRIHKHNLKYMVYIQS